MQAKSGKAGKPVEPAAPQEPYDADTANPGEVAELKIEQYRNEQGKYGSTPASPYKPPSNKEEKAEKCSWIEIELVDDSDKPIAGEKYEIELADGTVATGTLDGKGYARVAGIKPGNCKVTFPELDKEAWKAA